MNFIASSLRGAWSAPRAESCVAERTACCQRLTTAATSAQTIAGRMHDRSRLIPSVHDHPIPADWAHIGPTGVRIDEPSWFRSLSATDLGEPGSAFEHRRPRYPR